jgi:hypothetical protein
LVHDLTAILSIDRTLVTAVFSALVATQQYIYIYLFSKVPSAKLNEVITKQEGVKSLFDIAHTSLER